jgi:hypothetical protein
MRTAWTMLVLLLLAAGAVAFYFAAEGRGPAPLVRAWEQLSDWLKSSAVEWGDRQAVDAGAEAGAPPQRRQRGALSRAQLDAPLVHGRFVAACGAPDDMKVSVEVAVRAGRAVDVVAHSLPPNALVESCVERTVRDLRWDISPVTGHVTVRY